MAGRSKPAHYRVVPPRRAVEISISESGDFWVEVVCESTTGSFTWSAGQGRWMP